MVLIFFKFPFFGRFKRYVPVENVQSALAETVDELSVGSLYDALTLFCSSPGQDAQVRSVVSHALRHLQMIGRDTGPILYILGKYTVRYSGGKIFVFNRMSSAVSGFRSRKR